MTWLVILVVLAAAVAGSVAVTRPPDVSLTRHILGLLGQVVLDLVRTVLRVLVAVVVVIALLAATWSYVSPRVEAKAQEIVHAAVPTVTWPWDGGHK